MKRILIFAIGVFISSGCFAGTPVTSFTVDERFELTSIAARLAGYQEYCQGAIPEYNAAIDEYFAPYREHGLVAFMQQMRQDNSLAYDAIPLATQTLVIDDGCVRVSDDADIDRLCSYDPRWTKENYLKFVGLLDDFYKDTDFHGFFGKNTSLYESAAEIMRAMCPVNIGWFNEFFGDGMGKIGLCLAFANGYNSYMLRPSGVIDGAVLVLGAFFDPASLSVQDIGDDMALKYITKFIPDMCRIAVSPMIENNMQLFKPAAEVFFNEHDVRNIMRMNNVRDPQTLVYDWMTLLTTAMYFKDNGYVSFDFDSILADAARNGYFWLDSSIEAMGGFYSDREQYGCFEDYIPRMAEYFNDAAGHIGRERKHYASLFPEIVSSKTSRKRIRDSLVVEFTFSVPMQTSMMEIDMYPYDDGVETVTGPSVSYSDDSRRFIVKVAESDLEKGKHYGFTLPWEYFVSEKGYQMKGDYVFEFKF